MEIIFNKKLVETKEIDGEPCILITELIELAGVHFKQIYQKIRKKYSLHKYMKYINTPKTQHSRVFGIYR
ncbi:MAG: hypothetical protein IJD90_05430 [Clostridia bacterium]|nr:hypothetical protein [Clostridia bacterium]MBQ7659849.1 hypothetical protein [Alphaproteobacteria bacterium]